MSPISTKRCSPNLSDCFWPDPAGGNRLRKLSKSGQNFLKPLWYQEGGNTQRSREFPEKKKAMGEDRKQLFRSLSFLSGMGISMVAATFIGLAIGYRLDRWLGTSPWLTLIFLGLGIAAGFRNIFVMTSRELKRQQEENRDEHADK